MVKHKSVTQFSRSGIGDWLFQRMSAVVMLAYAVWLLAYTVWHAPLNYLSWHALFSGWCFKLLSVLALAALLIHSWIGLWVVFTDYIKPWCLRLLLHGVLLVTLLGYAYWVLTIVIPV